MKVYKYSELSEANLSIKDLAKPSADGKLRGDVLVSKIENDEEIIVNPIVDGKPSGDKKSIIVTDKDIIDEITDDTGNYNPEKGESYFKGRNRYTSVIDDGDVKYKLNDVEKTTEFGSPGGSKKRSDSTRYYETLACLFLSLRQRLRINIIESDINFILGKRNFDRCLNYVVSKVDVNPDILREFWDEWKNTFIKISNSLYNRNTIVNKDKKSNFCLYGNKAYKFYQISSAGLEKLPNNVCKEIFDAYTRCIKKLKLPFKPNMAKWNPSDIWAANIRAEEKICSSLRKCKNIDELNDCINQLFRTRDLVGISLKKVIKNDINIIINHMTDPPIYTFKHVKVSENSLNTISVDIVVNCESLVFGDGSDYVNRDEYMTIRSFDTNRGSDISGEIKGKAAQQGKISLTQINRILNTYGVETIPAIKPFKSGSKINPYNPDDYEPLSKLSNDELINEIELINNLVISKYGEVTSGNIEKNASRGRLYSKYQSLYLAWILSDISDEKLLNKIISDIFYYALSIKFDGIRTPMYVRVID